MKLQRFRALSNVAFKPHRYSTLCLLTRRTQPIRMNITALGSKSIRQGQLRARTSVITTNPCSISVFLFPPVRVSFAELEEILATSGGEEEDALASEWKICA